MVNTLNNQLQVFKTGLTKAHHERTYLRDQLNKSLKSYRDIQEQHLEDQKKKEQKRFFKSAKLKDALETKYYREFEEFEGGIRRILEALEKHIAVDSPTEGSLITIDSLGLL
jgi:flagellar motor protein MotB